MSVLMAFSANAGAANAAATTIAAVLNTFSQALSCKYKRPIGQTSIPTALFHLWAPKSLWHSMRESFQLYGFMHAMALLAIHRPEMAVITGLACNFLVRW